jgi:hypothetical protein
VPNYVWIPFIVLGALLALLAVFAILARVQGGRFLKPIAMALAKIPFLKKAFQKAAIANLERQNPPLAAAMKKIQVMGEPSSPDQVQHALKLLTPSERRAYMEAAEEQQASGAAGGFEPTNRQQRRRMEHGGAGMPQTTARPGAAGRKRKKR